MTNNFLSPAEHKILLGIGFLMLIMVIGNITITCIDAYNYQVEKEQKLKRGKESNDKTIDFEFYGNCSRPPIYEVILQLQIFTVPVLLLNLWKFKNYRFSNYLISLCLSAINLLCYFMWIYSGYLVRKENDAFDVNSDTFHSYLMINSTPFEFSTFICFVILFTAQTVFLLRFALERFQTKPLL